MTETKEAYRIREILALVKPLASEYYRLSGKPLGVTGEIAEYVAAELLGLELAPPRMEGYDAIRHVAGQKGYVQIKGRALTNGKGKPCQRLGRIKHGAKCDKVMLVILDNATLEPCQILEADYFRVCERLLKPSKAHDKGALSISEFRKVAKPIWPPEPN